MNAASRNCHILGRWTLRVQVIVPLWKMVQVCSESKINSEPAIIFTGCNFQPRPVL